MVFIDRSVSARLELAQGERAAHYAAAQARLLPSSAGTAVEIGGGRAIFAGPGSFVNRVFALGMQGAVAQDALDAIEAFYRARQAVARIDVCPFAVPRCCTWCSHAPMASSSSLMSWSARCPT
jgi:hypothetical protein